MTYEIRFSRSALKAIQKLPRQEAIRIFKKVDVLKGTPRPTGAKKLVGMTAWRIRSGNYRIIYDIFDKELVIQVLVVGHRKGVYKH